MHFTLIRMKNLPGEYVEGELRMATHIIPSIAFTCNGNLATLQVKGVDEVLPESEELLSHADFVLVVAVYTIEHD